MKGRKKGTVEEGSTIHGILSIEIKWRCGGWKKGVCERVGKLCVCHSLFGSIWWFHSKGIYPLYLLFFLCGSFKWIYHLASHPH
jgi:hypothetical protein